MLSGARRVAVLTGAGISVESGLPAYRGGSGMWTGFSMKEYASPEGFAADPEKVWDWHNQRRLALAQVRPNPGHAALAELERQIAARGGQFTLATQNVDGLHQAAGSRNVLELHGTILAVKCSRCEAARHIGFAPIQGVPRCDCGGLMRPDIVSVRRGAAPGCVGGRLPRRLWVRGLPDRRNQRRRLPRGRADRNRRRLWRQDRRSQPRTHRRLQHGRLRPLRKCRRRPAQAHWRLRTRLGTSKKMNHEGHEEHEGLHPCRCSYGHPYGLVLRYSSIDGSDPASCDW